MPTYNAVDDLGMDPNGNTPILDALDSVYGDNTTVEFPPGTYLVDGIHQAGGADGFTIRGLGQHRRDVQFLPARMLGDPFLRWEGGGRHTIENVSFQQTDDRERSLAILVRNPDGSVVRNVEWLGRTPEEGSEGSSDRAPYLFTFDVTNRGGVGTVEDLVIGADMPAEKPPYPRGRPAIRQGPSHEGEAIFNRMEIIDQGSSAFRSTDNPGVCTVRNSFFKDNANANLRYGAGEHPSKVSTSKNVYVLLTEARSGDVGAHEVGDAVRVMGHPGQEGAIFEDIVVEIHAGAQVSRGGIAAPDWGDHGTATFRNCIVYNDADTPHVNLEPPEEGSFSDTTIYFEGSDFIGSGQGFRLDRPAQFTNCCAASGLDTDGASLSRGGCRGIPDDPLGDGTQPPSPPDDGNGGDPSPQATSLEIANDGSARTNYEVVVDGEITRTSGFGTGDSVSDDRTTATGFVRGGADTVFYTGCVQVFSYDGPKPVVMRDGAAVNADNVVECPPTNGGNGGNGGSGNGSGGDNVDRAVQALGALAIGGSIYKIIKG